MLCEWVYYEVEGEDDVDEEDEEDEEDEDEIEEGAYEVTLLI